MLGEITKLMWMIPDLTQYAIVPSSPAGKVRYQIGVKLGKMTIFSGVVLGEVTVLEGHVSNWGNR